MDFEKIFPLRFWINLARREDRRVRMKGVLEQSEITAERFPAVDARRCKVKEGGVRGYESAGRYALALTQRLAIREAKRRGAPAVLLLEDDVIFHPNFRALARMTEVPEDWGIFYFGCVHFRKPEWAGRRVVKCSYAVDTHAVAVKSEYYDQVLEILDRHGKEDLPGVAKASDQFMAFAQKDIPSYACYPNLAWQAESPSDLTGGIHSNYHRDGLQKNREGVVEGLLEELTAEREDEKSGARRPGSEVKLGLLFLTRDDVNHPGIWREFVTEMPEGVRVFSHRKKRKKECRDGYLPPPQSEEEQMEADAPFLDGTEVRKWFDTKWGDISLVRAARAMLLEALEDESLTHFALLSEACVPVMPLREIIRRLEIDPRSQFDFRSIEERSAVLIAKVRATPGVPRDCWKFTSQWWLMDRTTAVFAAAQDFTELFENTFAPDEGYFATVLTMQGYPLSGQVRQRSSTWTKWTHKASHPEEWEKFPREQLEGLMLSGSYFARKFPKGADIGKYMLHRDLTRESSIVVEMGKK